MNAFNKVNTELFGSIGTGTGVAATLSVTPESIAYYLSLVCTIICAVATIVTLFYKGYVKIKEALEKKDFDKALNELQATEEAIKNSQEKLRELLKKQEGEDDDI